MISGLPTLPIYGSSEIIQDGENGFHINPTNLEETALKILNFINQCDNNSQYWQEISDIKRVRDKYNWCYIPMICYCAYKIQASWAMFTRKTKGNASLSEALFYLFYKPRAENS